MNAWQAITQPLPNLASSGYGRALDTFSAYLQRHQLNILDAARLAALPSSLVWRVCRWQAISEKSAGALVEVLALITGETFKGSILTVCNDGQIKARRFI